MKYKEIKLEIVANNIRKARKEKCVSMDQLVKMTGVAKSTISNIENYKADPKLVTISKIAKALDYRLEDLLY